jgi:hypothetical protein
MTKAFKVIALKSFRILNMQELKQRDETSGDCKRFSALANLPKDSQSKNSKAKSRFFFDFGS